VRAASVSLYGVMSGLHLTDIQNHATLLQEHRDQTDAVRTDLLTEVVAVIVSNVFEELIVKHASMLLNDVTDHDCHHPH